MIDQYVRRPSGRRRLGVALFSHTRSAIDPGDDRVGRVEIAKASPKSLRYTATTGAR